MNFPCKCSECKQTCNTLSDLLNVVANECEREECECPLMAWLDHDADEPVPFFPIYREDVSH